MKNKTACCFGHRNVYKPITEPLRQVVGALIVEENVSVFMTGGMGEFDRQFAAVVREFQMAYSQIALWLIKPYFSNQLNTNRDYYNAMYDEVIIPDAVEGVHPKAAIRKRNRWMVENSDFVVGFVHRDFGGAHEALTYAQKLDKRVWNLATNGK